MSKEKAGIAREAKKAKIGEQATEKQPIVQTSSESAEATPAVHDLDSESSDETFDPEKEASSSTQAVLEWFVVDWVLTLDRDNIISPSLFF